MEQVKFKDNSQTNLIELKMEISRGKFQALIGALRTYNTPVGNDLLGMILRARGTNEQFESAS